MLKYIHRFFVGVNPLYLLKVLPISLEILLENMILGFASLAFLPKVL